MHGLAQDRLCSATQSKGEWWLFVLRQAQHERFSVRPERRTATQSKGERWLFVLRQAQHERFSVRPERRTATQSKGERWLFVLRQAQHERFSVRPEPFDKLRTGYAVRRSRRVNGGCSCFDRPQHERFSVRPERRSA